MPNDTDIIALRQPESVDDPLTEIARDGARRMLVAALRAEADAFVAQHANDVLPEGRQRVVRHGYGPERSIQTGIGALDVRSPKVRGGADHGRDPAPAGLCPAVDTPAPPAVRCRNPARI